MHRHFHDHPMFAGRGRHGFFGSRGPFGGGGHGFFGGGAGLRASKMLASGDLQLIILLLLEEKPRHGYEIIKAIEEHSSGVYTPSPGMVYPALTYLEEMGYTASETEGTKKLCRITDAGIEYLAKNRESVNALMEQLSRYGEKVARFQEQAVAEETEDEKWGGGPREQAKREWRQMKDEFREIKHSLKAAIIEKMHAPLEEKQRVLDVLRKAIAEIRKK